MYFNKKCLDWSTYFGGAPYTKKYELKTAFQASSGSFYVASCDFIRQTDYAAVRIGDSSAQDNLLVEDTSFTECSSTGSYSFGGSLYFRSSGSFIHDRVCYSKSVKDSGSDITFYVYVPDAATTKLYINLTTVANCGTSTSTGSRIFCIERGPEFSSNFNITKNKCRAYSGYIHNGGSSNINNKFLNIRDNSQQTQTIIGMWTNGLTNIIDNSRTNDGRGIITGRGNFEFESCCILGNIGTPLFHIEADLKTVGLTNCYADTVSSYSCTLAIQNSVKSPFTVVAPFLSLGECVAQIIYAKPNKIRQCSNNIDYSCHNDYGYLIYYVIIVLNI